MNSHSKYCELLPSKEFTHLIDSFWTHKNVSNSAQTMTIVPDSFFKIVFLIRDNHVINYFLTGLWTEDKEFTIPARSMSFGCRLKILAPEYLIQSEIASISNSLKQLDIDYLNIRSFNYDHFNVLVRQWQSELAKVVAKKEITGNKLRLSRLLYSVKGALSVSEVADQIYWTPRQINRYMNKWLGTSLKPYLNIQKCYQSYLHIRAGQLQPKNAYFDQSHFIREIKKHTGETPATLYEQQNDRFIQLKNIQEK